MSPTYNYVRGMRGGQYLIPNKERVTLDDPPKQIHLAKEIEAALGSKMFRVRCNANDCDVVFEEALTLEEKETLDGLITDHKENN